MNSGFVKQQAPWQLNLLWRKTNYYVDLADKEPIGINFTVISKFGKVKNILAM